MDAGFLLRSLWAVFILLPLFLLFLLFHLLLLALFLIFLATFVSHACSFFAIMTRTPRGSNVVTALQDVKAGMNG
jgi:hypothetical protein